MRTQAICLALAIVLLCPFASAQWVQTNGPCGGYVHAFAVSGTNLFAGTEAGVFRSTNSGTSWERTGLTGPRVNALAVSPASGGTGATNIFAGTGDGVFLSTNNGTSWSGASIGLTDTYVYALAFCGTNLFAGTSEGVFLSNDNGTSWSAVNGGLPGDPYSPMRTVSVSCFATSGQYLFAGTEKGVFLSTINGTSWTVASTGLASTNIHSLVVSGVNLYAGTYGGGVYRSTNNGTSWAPAGLAATCVVALAVSGTSLYAGAVPT